MAGVPVKVIVLEKIPEDPETIRAWNDLALGMERPQVFFTQQWALAVSRAFGQALFLRTLLLYQDNQLAGVAALATKRESTDSAFFLTAGTADYCDILSASEHRLEVVASVVEEGNRLGFRNLVLANLPVESHTLPALKLAARSGRFHLYERSAYDCDVISLGNEAQRQQVLGSVARKERVKRGLKKLGHLGPVTVTHWNSEQLKTQLPAIFSAQITRFLVTDRTSPLLRPERRNFLSELGNLLDSEGWLKVSQMELNGDPLAWNFGFRFGDSWFWYLPTFRIQYEEFSPGSCLLRLLIEEACVDPSVKRLDLGLGDEAYKKRFSNKVSSTHYVQMSKNISDHLGNIARHRLASASAKFPALDKRFRRGREFLRTIRSRIRTVGLMATTAEALRRAKRSVLSEEEAAFFEAPQIGRSELDLAELSPMTWEAITSAAVTYADDGETLQYLMRCARRLRRGRAQGYFTQERGTQAHFLWVDAYDGFHVDEIGFRLEATDPSAALIFDCWTPGLVRGHGHYASAVRRTAAHLQAQQKKVWIFSSAKNRSSVAGILKAGFKYQFSLVREKKFWHTAVSRRVRSGF